MNIDISKKTDNTVLTVNSASLAGDDARDLKSIAIDLIESGEKKIALDLTRPEYIDSSGIGKLLFMNKKLEKTGGEFSIIKINKTLYDFLDSLAITKVMKISNPI